MDGLAENIRHYYDLDDNFLLEYQNNDAVRYISNFESEVQTNESLTREEQIEMDNFLRNMELPIYTIRKLNGN